ncbi:MAG: hypothetical protein OXI57_10570 [Rhodospirillales bacterium]|nr:hypothetical protein [Rhodospirillales bacterium]
MELYRSQFLDASIIGTTKLNLLNNQLRIVVTYDYMFGSGNVCRTGGDQPDDPFEDMPGADETGGAGIRGNPPRGTVPAGGAERDRTANSDQYRAMARSMIL